MNKQPKETVESKTSKDGAEVTMQSQLLVNNDYIAFTRCFMNTQLKQGIELKVITSKDDATTVNNSSL